MSLRRLKFRAEWWETSASLAVLRYRRVLAHALPPLSVAMCNASQRNKKEKKKI